MPRKNFVVTIKFIKFNTGFPYRLFKIDIFTTQSPFASFEVIKHLNCVNVNRLKNSHMKITVSDFFFRLLFIDGAGLFNCPGIPGEVAKNGS